MKKDISNLSGNTIITTNKGDMDIKDLVEKVKENYKELVEVFNLMPIEDDEFPYKEAISILMYERLSDEAMARKVIKDAVIYKDYIYIKSLKDLVDPFCLTDNYKNIEVSSFHNMTYSMRSMEFVLAATLMNELCSKECLKLFFLEVLNSIRFEATNIEDCKDSSKKYCYLVYQLDQNLLEEITSQLTV